MLTLVYYYNFDSQVILQLQGQFAFVVYDSSKRQVFAARDASGKEPLYVNYDDEHGTAFSNKPSAAWGASEGDWQEVSRQLDSSLRLTDTNRSRICSHCSLALE